MPRISARNSSDRIEISGFFRPAAAKMSMTSSEDDGLGDDLPDGMVEVLVGLALVPARSSRAPARTAWKKPTSSRIAKRLVVRHRQRERLRQSSVTALSKRGLAVFLRQDVLLRAGQHATGALARVPVDPSRPIEAVEQAAADLVLLQHDRDGFRLVDAPSRPCRRSRCRSPAPASVRRQARGNRPPARRACP